MFDSQAYTNLGSSQTSIAGVPAVVKSKEEVSQDFKGKRFLAAALIAVSLSVSSLQAGFVLNANATGNPISAPITVPTTIQCPDGKVAKVVDSTIICVTSGNEQNQEQNNNGGTSSSSGSVITVTVNPITSPEVSPSPTPTPQPSSNNGGGNNDGGNNGGGGNGGGGSAPSCNNEAPKAPKIVSATSAGKNEVTLNWEKAAGNVTHYAISYGFLKGKPLYGNTNIGNVTSYTVKGLSVGVTYYFTVNGVNGCTAGPASNEIGIKGGGKFINAPAVGFKNTVLGNKTSGKTVQFKAEDKKPVVKVSESQVNNPIKFHFEGSNTLNPGLLGKAVNFIKGWFN